MANKLVSILPSGTNNYLTPSLSFNRLATDLVSPGVVGTITNTSGVAPATGAYAVNAQGAPNMTVAVSTGNAYVSGTPSGGTAQTFGVTSDATENVTIAANSTGSTRYDFIYLQLDTTKLNTPAVNGLDVASFVTSRSTTAYDSTNTTTYGNSNGAQAGLLLAVVTVANAAASIGNASITDARVSMGPKLIPSLAITSSRSLSNPYKFYAYRNAAWANSNSSSAKVGLDAKVFDTGSNFDSVTNNRFTAPVAGFYQFNFAIASQQTAGIGYGPYLKKNGTTTATNGTQVIAGYTSTFALQLTGAGLLQLAANDYIELWSTGGGATNAGVTGPEQTFLSGFLVSTT